MRLKGYSFLNTGPVHCIDHVKPDFQYEPVLSIVKKSGGSLTSVIKYDIEQEQYQINTQVESIEVPEFPVSLMLRINISKQSFQFFPKKGFDIDGPAIGLINDLSELTPVMGKRQAPCNKQDQPNIVIQEFKHRLFFWKPGEKSTGLPDVIGVLRPPVCNGTF